MKKVKYRRLNALAPSLQAWILCFMLFTHPPSQASEPSPIPATTRQLVLALVPAYPATQGVLYKFQRREFTAPWEMIETEVQIVIGRSGLGWGKGLHHNIPANCPIKKEGDGRSPAGVFMLSTAFGFTSLEELQPLHFPYLQITAALECVDDNRSQHYNSLADRQKISEVDWQSSEKMHEIKNAYRLGVFVDHNVAPRAAGAGSCIFLHVWSGASSPTSGCTAMAATEMEKIVKWLRRDANPVLVQLPLEEFTRLRESWQLPLIEEAFK